MFKIVSNPTNRTVFPWQTNILSIEMEEWLVNNLTYIINVNCQKVVFLIQSLEGHNLWQVSRRKTKLLTERFFPHSGYFMMFHSLLQNFEYDPQKKGGCLQILMNRNGSKSAKVLNQASYWHSAWEFSTFSTYECSAVELSGDNMQSAPTQILSWEIEPTCKCLGRQSCACSLLKNILLKAVSTLCCCQIRPVYIFCTDLVFTFKVLFKLISLRNHEKRCKETENIIFTLA